MTVVARIVLRRVAVTRTHGERLLARPARTGSRRKVDRRREQLPLPPGFVDRRAASDEARELLRFPDGTGVVVQGDRVLYVRDELIVHEVALPSSEGWVHLGWRLHESEVRG